MSKILEFFGINKSENSQKPMQPPSGRDLLPQPGFSAPSQPIRDTGKRDVLFDQSQTVHAKPIIDQKPLTTNPQFSNTQSSNPPKINSQNGVITESHASVIQPKPRSRDRNLQNSTPQPTTSMQAQPLIRNTNKFDLPFNVDQIRQDLVDCGQKTFPSAFPSKPIYPDSFPNSLKLQAMDLKTVQKLAEDSSTNQNQDNKIAKFYNIKKEVDFYKKYITMNDIKKQKMQQEVHDLKNIQMSYRNDDSVHHPEFERQQQEVYIRQKEIEEEMREMEILKSQSVNNLVPVNGHFVNNQYEDWQNINYNQVQPGNNFESLRSIGAHQEPFNFGDQLYNNNTNNVLDQSYSNPSYPNHNVQNPYPSSQRQVNGYNPHPVHYNLPNSSHNIHVQQPVSNYQYDNIQSSNRNVQTYNQEYNAPLNSRQPQTSHYQQNYNIQNEPSFLSVDHFKDVGHVNGGFGDFNPLQPAYPQQSEKNYPSNAFTRAPVQQQQTKFNPLMKKI
jgi:hypothetical protein